MKYTNIKIILPFLILLILGSCTEGFEELNTNPNDPTLVAPDVIFPYAVREGVDRIHGHRTRLERIGLDGGMCWVQYFARNQYTNEGDTYNPDGSMRNNNWKGFFNESLINFQKVIDFSSDPEGPFYNENYAAVGLIMREYMFSVVTDIWGAIPYNFALEGSKGNLAPTYDDQASIYASMLANLKSASDALDENGASIKGDILFSGDILKWKKFANSLRIRLANRQAAKASSESTTIIAEIMGNPDQYPVFTGNDDFAELFHAARLNDNNNNAWHEVMIIDAREDWSISQTLIDAMADADGNLLDPRLAIYANAATAGDFAGKYAGAINGLPESIASVYINTASRPGSYFTEENAPFCIMTYSELLFTLAEAALDGEYKTGDAQALMESAIQASFEQYDLEMPADYLTDMVADKETIMTEKWKALFGQGLEAWTEYRRTGYPVLPGSDTRAIFENDG